jgi:hypothetical protein
VRNKSIYQVEAFRIGFRISHTKEKKLDKLTRKWLVCARTDYGNNSTSVHHRTIKLE